LFFGLNLASPITLTFITSLQHQSFGELRKKACLALPGANVLIFPNLDAAHIAVRLMATVGGATVMGPILMGMRRPVNSIQPTASVDDIVNLAAITALQAQKEYQPWRSKRS